MASNYEEEALARINPSGSPGPSLMRPQNTYKPKTNLPSGGTSFKPGMGPGLTATATGVGADIAANQVGKTLTGGSGAASGAPGWTSGAAGMGLGMGIGMAGNAISQKLKPKEEMPTYGGRHGDILDQYGRRFEGAGPGVHGGAVQGASMMASNIPLTVATMGLAPAAGAIVGAIAGGATKNATSAFSDFSANDAYDAIGRAYKKYLGRDASDDEIMGRLIGQGYKPDQGHKYVGEKGLMSQLDFIADSPEAQAYLAQQAGLQNLGGSTPASPAQASNTAATPPTVGGTPAGSPASPSTNTPENYSLATSSNPPAPAGQPLAGFPNGASERPSLTTPGGIQINQDFPTASNATVQDTQPTIPQGLGPYQLEGYDSGKLNSGHDSPKYQIGRVLSQFDPRAGLTPEVLAKLNSLGIGTFSGQRDKLNVSGGDPRFNGLTSFDVVRDFDGNGGWQFAEDGPSAPVQNGPGFNLPLTGITPQTGSGGPYYSDAVIRYLMQSLGLDRAASNIAG